MTLGRALGEESDSWHFTRKKRIFVMSIKRDIEFCDQHHIHAKHSIKDHAADRGAEAGTALKFTKAQTHVLLFF